MAERGWQARPSDFRAQSTCCCPLVMWNAVSVSRRKMNESIFKMMMYYTQVRKHDDDSCGPYWSWDDFGNTQSSVRTCNLVLDVAFRLRPDRWILTSHKGCMCVWVCVLFLTKKTSCENILGWKGIKGSQWDWSLTCKSLLLGRW